MRKLRYHLVDVFTDRQFGGNPLAVFTNGRGIRVETMQAIAKELNLSETTYVLPPDTAANDYRVRIFTPGKELPMAGHPTVGTTYVLAREHMIERGEDGAETEIKLEEGVGTIPVRIEWREGAARFIEMRQPLPTFGPRVEDLRAVAEMLSIELDEIEGTNLPVEVVSCGVPFLYVPVRSLRAVQNIKFRVDVWESKLKHVVPPEVFVFTREVEFAGSTVHSRMFAPGMGIWEDPATGGASGPLGCYLVRYGVVACDGWADITSEQGVEMGRASFIKIKIARDAGGEITDVRVGGECRFMGEGYLEIED
ncbi:MAG: trans-2,3-dihydro-3-hydroxyanthranilate isomerase [Pyrinomonadaceae bacterium]|nr:trans-2,3-dihydro-3-hydroxyanthranilate isomerase [Pyrinomonadaceae bacterium]